MGARHRRLFAIVEQKAGRRIVVEAGYWSRTAAREILKDRYDYKEFRLWELQGVASQQGRRPTIALPLCPPVRRKRRASYNR